MKVVIALLIACVLASCSGAKGADALFPSTRKGWGVAVIVVGAAWIVVGGAIAANSDEKASVRIGGGLGAAAIGTVLIWLGWKLGDFGAKPAPASQ